MPADLPGDGRTGASVEPRPAPRPARAYGRSEPRDAFAGRERPDGGTGVPDLSLESLDEGDPELRQAADEVRAAQQKLVTRDPDGLLIIQGGVGTGRTLVGLRRVSWLLDNGFDSSDVLIVGPHPTYVRYVGSVLPEMTERGLACLPISSLGPEVRVTRIDPPELRRVKGDRRMLRVIASALRERQLVDQETIEMRFQGRIVRIDGTRIAARARQLAGRPHNEANRDLRSFLIDELRSVTSRGDRGPESSARNALVQPVDAYLEHAWPSLTPQAFLLDLLSTHGMLELAAAGLLSDDEIELLAIPEDVRVGGWQWSADDVPLLDAADVLLNGPPATHRHVLVDEAQDLSPMQLESVRRRSTAGSMTLLGDLAQGTSAWTHPSWEEVALHVRRDRVPTEVTSLDLDYRLPGEVHDVAARLLRLVASDDEIPQPVRPDGKGVVVTRAAGDLAKATVDTVEQLLLSSGTVGVIVAARQRARVAAALERAGLSWSPELRGGPTPVVLLSAAAAKGLEVDAVVVVEPEQIVSESEHGLRSLLVAVTRGTERLALVHDDRLPAELGPVDRPPRTRRTRRTRLSLTSPRSFGGAGAGGPAATDSRGPSAGSSARPGPPAAPVAANGPLRSGPRTANRPEPGGAGDAALGRDPGEPAVRAGLRESPSPGSHAGPTVAGPAESLGPDGPAAAAAGEPQPQPPPRPSMVGIERLAFGHRPADGPRTSPAGTTSLTRAAARRAPAPTAPRSAPRPGGAAAAAAGQVEGGGLGDAPADREADAASTGVLPPVPPPPPRPTAGPAAPTFPPPPAPETSRGVTAVGTAAGPGDRCGTTSADATASGLGPDLGPALRRTEVLPAVEMPPGGRRDVAAGPPTPAPGGHAWPAEHAAPGGDSWPATSPDGDVWSAAVGQPGQREAPIAGTGAPPDPWQAGDRRPAVGGVLPDATGHPGTTDDPGRTHDPGRTDEVIDRDMHWGEPVWNDAARDDPPAPALDWRKSIPREFVARTATTGPSGRRDPEPARPAPPDAPSTITPPNGQPGAFAGSLPGRGGQPRDPGYGPAGLIAGDPGREPARPAPGEIPGVIALRSGEILARFGPRDEQGRSGPPRRGEARGARVHGGYEGPTPDDLHRGVADAGDRRANTGFRLADDREPATGSATWAGDGRSGPTGQGRHLASDDVGGETGPNGSGRAGPRGLNGRGGPNETDPGHRTEMPRDRGPERHGDEPSPGAHDTGPWNELDREIARALASALAGKLIRYVNGPLLPLVADELARMVGSLPPPAGVSREAGGPSHLGSGDRHDGDEPARAARHLGDGTPPRR